MPEQQPPFPLELSAPFAGRGRWLFRLYGGPFDGGSSYQQLDGVARVGEELKWRRGASRAAIYTVISIDAHAGIIYIQHSKTSWAGW